MDELTEKYRKIMGLLSDPETLDALDEKDKVSILEWADHLKYEWELHARDSQKIPPGTWTTWIILAGRGYGKLLALDTPILTPDRGFVELGDIEVGDYVFDERGEPTKVLDTFDDTPETAYRLSFSDGTSIDACSEHQWVTWTHAERKAHNRSRDKVEPLPEDWPNWVSGVSVNGNGGIGPKIRLTQEIVDTLKYGKRDDTNHSIPVTEAVDFEAKTVPLDPYLFGYWVGDGYHSGGTITVHENDMPSLMREFDRADVVWSKPKSSPQTLTMRGAVPALREIGAYGTKNIPDEYLFNSINNRLALLQGLMDSDGYCNPGGNSVEFSSKRKDHAEAVLWLARSFGEKPVLSSGRAMLDGVDYGEKYRVIWNPVKVNPFRLVRKASLVKNYDSQQSRNYHRMIVDAEEISSEPMRCLTVDSPNSLFLAGEALIPTHNTRVGAETVRHYVQKEGYRSIGLIGPTAADARDTMIDGKGGSSLLEVTPQSEGLEYFPTKRRLVWANGAKGSSYSAEEPERLRGPQNDLLWSDELASWRYLQETWDMAMFGLRLGKQPKHIITTTPRPLPILKELVSNAVPVEEMTDDIVAEAVVTRGSTMDNRDNLAPQFLQSLMKKYEGTRLGRQELYAEILDDNPNALFAQVNIDHNRVDVEKGVFKPGAEVKFKFRDPQGADRKQDFKSVLSEIIISVDPSMSSDKSSDETGIVVMAVDRDSHAFVLEDASGIYSPNDWAERVLRLYMKYEADAIVAEVNQGGDLVENTIRTAEKDLDVGRVKYKKVRASKGKYSRAEPVGALEEQGRIHHVGDFPKLEEQLVTFQPGYSSSPDRLDAYVWGAHHLIVQREKKGFFIF